MTKTPDLPRDERETPRTADERLRQRCSDWAADVLFILPPVSPPAPPLVPALNITPLDTPRTTR